LAPRASAHKSAGIERIATQTHNGYTLCMYFRLAVLLDRLSERLRWTRLDGAPLLSRRKFG
jgi:hypothetical protein